MALAVLLEGDGDGSVLQRYQSICRIFSFYRRETGLRAESYIEGTGLRHLQFVRGLVEHLSALVPDHHMMIPVAGLADSLDL